MGWSNNTASHTVEDLRMGTLSQILAIFHQDVSSKQKNDNIFKLSTYILKGQSPELDQVLYSLCMLKNNMEKHGTKTAKECIHFVLGLPDHLYGNCTCPAHRILF